MERKSNLKSIGHNIQLARLKKGFTQEVLAEKCNVSAKYISALETGLSAGSIPLIIDICNILDITPNYIFDKALNINKLNNSINIIDSQTLIYYEKLKTENKEFVNETIKHLYNMQKKEIIKYFLQKTKAKKKLCFCFYLFYSSPSSIP